MQCPLCGNEADPVGIGIVGRKLFIGEREVDLTTSEAKIAGELLKNYPGYTPHRRLEFVLYADKVDGGPLTASNTVYVLLNRLRPKLAPEYTISRRDYRIEKVEK